MNTRFWGLFAACTLLALLSGCGGSDYDRPDAVSPTPTPTLGDDVDLSGSWAIEVVNAQIFDGTLGEDNVTLTTRSHLTLDHPSGALSIDTNTTVCSVDLSPYSGNQTTYPQAAVDAIPVLPGLSTVSASKEGAHFVSVPSVRLIGWSANGDPATEALPPDDGDSRVFDADGDGNPGVTLEVEGNIVSGDIYIVNRSITDLDGSVVTKDRIAGNSTTNQGQNILGATNALLELGNIDARPDETPGASHFTMVRVAAGTDCAAIVSDPTLFD